MFHAKIVRIGEEQVVILPKELHTNSKEFEIEVLEESYILRAVLPPKSSYEKWEQDEIDKLILGFDNGLTVNELAQNHNRSEGAIRSRLEKMDKI